MQLGNFRPPGLNHQKRIKMLIFIVDSSEHSCYPIHVDPLQIVRAFVFFGCIFNVPVFVCCSFMICVFIHQIKPESTDDQNQRGTKMTQFIYFGLNPKDCLFHIPTLPPRMWTLKDADDVQVILTGNNYFPIFILCFPYNNLQVILTGNNYCPSIIQHGLYMTPSITHSE